MNRKMLVVGTLMLAVAAGTLALAERTGLNGNTKNAGACPMHVPGAEVKVVNIESGVVIHVMGGDAATVAKIQAAAAGIDGGEASHSGCKHCNGARTTTPATTRSQSPAQAACAHGDSCGDAKGDVYACAMGDYAGPQTKDGRCPKCGMSLSLKK